ncbi:Bcr/CflA family efflux MFS transporter [Rhodobacterales bacterium HKCCE4037]|nr:Bcr/CflA family efflux MFS transporter [Rhodobacterales bacterium HKCCE4037]
MIPSLQSVPPPRLFTLVVLTGIAAMSANIFLPSLAGMADYFETDYAVMQLAVALFLAINAVLQLMLGPLSDRFGRRPLMVSAFAIFAVSSIGCALAKSVEVFLIFRTFQATGFASVVLSRAIIRDMVPGTKAASMIGYVTMGMAVVPMVSPTIGGLLDAAYGWQASFVLVAILGVFACALAILAVGETHVTRSASFAEQAGHYPELFRSRRFWGYAAAGAFGGATFFTFLGGAPYVGSQVFGLDPPTLGLFFGSASFGYVTGNFLSGRYSGRFGINMMLLAGALVQSLSLGISLIVLLSGYGSAWTFFGLMILVSLGNGLIVPNATAGFLSVRPHLAGTASGIGGALMIGGGAVLVSWAGTFLDPVNGAIKLVALQFCAAVLSLCAALVTRRWER